MFKKLFGASSMEPLSDGLRALIETQLSEFCASLFRALELGAQASQQAPADARETFMKVESAADSARASLSRIADLWPAGKSAFAGLTNIAVLLPRWIENLKSWQVLIETLEADSRKDRNLEEYRQFQMKGRQYSAGMDKGLADAASELSKIGISFDSIQAKSLERQSLAGQQ